MTATVSCPAPVPPLGIVTPDTQLELNRQGVRAIFAGFVIAARARQVAPSIRSLWVSDQLQILLPSLKVLHTLASSESGNPQEDTALQQTLLDVLLDNNNLTSAAVSFPDHQPGIEWYIDTEWMLSKQGKKTMPRGATAVNVRQSSGATTPASPNSNSASTHNTAWWDG